MVSRTNPLFTEAEYSLMASAGEEITVKGVYSIVDGGYHRWVATMSASRLITGEDFARFAFTFEHIIFLYFSDTLKCA